MINSTLIGSPGRLVTGFFQWFWRQSLPAMVITTIGIVIASNYALAYLGFSGASRYELTTTIGMVLLLTTVVACFARALLGTDRKRRS